MAAEDYFDLDHADAFEEPEEPNYWFENVYVYAKTEQAVLIELTSKHGLDHLEGRHWIPKSQILSMYTSDCELPKDNLDACGYYAQFSVTDWFARKAGW